MAVIGVTQHTAGDGTKMPAVHNLWIKLTPPILSIWVVPISFAVCKCSTLVLTPLFFVCSFNMHLLSLLLLLVNYYYYYYYYYYDHHCYKLFSAFLWWTSQDDNNSAGSFHCWRNQFRSVPSWMQTNKFTSILWWLTRFLNKSSQLRSIYEWRGTSFAFLSWKKKIFHCWWKEICFEGELSGIILEH